MAKKSSASPKTARFELRLTVEEKREMEERAAERKLTLAEYLTRAGLGRAARQRADVDAIHQLMLCVEQLKAIHHTLRQLDAGDALLPMESLHETMEAVCEAIQRVWTTGGER
ncbi:hypothetical protein FX016_22930 [Cupriavidus gilardii]|nr:hypothetical protein FX016_22930 [Cupriavidus gilardii]